VKGKGFVCWLRLFWFIRDRKREDGDT